MTISNPDALDDLLAPLEKRLGQGDDLRMAQPLTALDEHP
jgi:hypothetical protein